MHFCFRIEERKMFHPIFHILLATVVVNITIVNGQSTTTTTTSTTRTVDVTFPGNMYDMDLTKDHIL